MPSDVQIESLTHTHDSHQNLCEICLSNLFTQNDLNAHLPEDHDEPEDRYLCEICLAAFFGPDETLFAQIHRFVLAACAIPYFVWQCITEFVFSYSPIVTDAIRNVIGAIFDSVLLFYQIGHWLFADDSPEKERATHLRHAHQARLEEDKWWKEQAKFERWGNQAKDENERRYLDTVANQYAQRALEAQRESDEHMDRFRSVSDWITD